MAVSFNMVKKAKIIITFIYLFSFIFNIPQAILVTDQNYKCLPYGQARMKSYGMTYYWFSFAVNSIHWSFQRKTYT